jgi:hypothetical protein
MTTAAVTVAVGLSFGLMALAVAQEGNLAQQRDRVILAVMAAIAGGLWLALELILSCFIWATNR